jgi:hypothetical protein
MILHRMTLAKIMFPRVKRERVGCDNLIAMSVLLE